MRPRNSPYLPLSAPPPPPPPRLFRLPGNPSGAPARPSAPSFSPGARFPCGQPSHPALTTPGTAAAPSTPSAGP